MRNCGKTGKIIKSAVKILSALVFLFSATADLILPPAVSIAGTGIFRRMAANTHSVRFFDNSGTLTGALPAAGGEWRILIPGPIPEKVEKAFTAVEDWRFRKHCGIDSAAVLRAAFQNFTTGGIVSGASTITMQLARCLDYRGRSWQSKIRESLRALALERHLDKDTILRLYLDNLPFGGRIYGLETAAQYYFASTTADLTDEELALLAGLPQRPNAYRPDKHPQAAVNRRKDVLQLFVYHNIMTKEFANEINGRPLHLQRGDFAAHAVTEELQSRHYCQIASAESDSPAITTFLNREWQRATVAMAGEWTKKISNVNDCAIVIINNRDLTVPVLVGTLDFYSPAAGMVNSAAARRSPGSLLKPFIYGCAVKKGLIVPDTAMTDDPVNIHGYMPENFTREFTGRTTAAKALADSLNIPAVELLARVGEKEWLEELQKFGFAPWPDTAPGLSAALGGGVEISPLEAAGAYAAIANGGVYIRPRFTTASPLFHPERIWSESTAFLVNTMLRRPLPGAPEIDAAWKTGTSQGRRDAWCAVWDRDFTVIVWLGNKQGAGASALVGVDAAAPLAGKLLMMLHAGNPQTPWQNALEAGTDFIQLCSGTGLRAWTGCAETFSGLAAEDIPLQPCRKCSSLTPSVQKGTLLQPSAGTIYAVNTDGAKVDFQANKDAMWFCNGEFLGSGIIFTKHLPCGIYTVTTFFPSDNSTATAKIEIKPLQKGTSTKKRTADSL